MCRAYSPDSSERYAIDFPSGDHAGSRSTTSVVLVKLRMSPFSAGAVKISPPHAEHRAGACRRDLRGANSLRLDFQEVRADFCEVGYRPNVQRAVVSGLQVQQMQRSELLVDNGISRCGGGLDIESIVF